ncbi:MAG: hypothetical protein WDM94_10895 [Bauldia sp.]
MKPIRFAVAALACALLAGCYTSDKLLVTDADSVADYSKITFTGSEDDAKPAAFTRADKHYVTESDGNTVELRLKRIDGDYYVAQLSNPKVPEGESGAQILYGYLHLDAGKGEAQTWRTYGTKDDVQAGMRMCKDVICIDDLAAYVAYAQKAVADGDKPDSTFKVAVEK